MSEFRAMMNNLKQKARDSWAGIEGERRAKRLEAFLNEMLAEYSKALGMNKTAILRALENRRDYSAINYYQRAKFPKLEGVRVFDTEEEVRQICASKKFRCPACEGVSTDPYDCDAGECDWKSYGLLHTLGKGLRVVCKDTFLENGMVHEIFMPLELEESEVV